MRRRRSLRSRSRYTYAVDQRGQHPLRSVALADDTAVRTRPDGATADGNSDAVLDVGETWNYQLRPRRRRRSR